VRRSGREEDPIWYVLELLRSVGDQRATETAHRAWLLTYRDRADAIAEIRDPVLAVVGKARCVGPSACGQKCWYSAPFMVAPRPSFETLICRLI
jgi:hypothetical protein